MKFHERAIDVEIAVLNRRGKLPRCAKYTAVRSIPAWCFPQVSDVTDSADYNLTTCGAGCLSPGEIGNRKLESVRDFSEVNLSPWNISFRRFWAAPRCRWALDE